MRTTLAVAAMLGWLAAGVEAQDRFGEAEEGFGKRVGDKAAEVMSRFDKDQDGFLSTEESKASDWDPPFADSDLDKDGRLSRTELYVRYARKMRLQDRERESTRAAESITEETLDPTEERTDLTPAQLRDLAATLRINAALDKNTSLESVEQPLSEVVRQISKEHKIPIVLDPDGLETARVEADQLVTITLERISLRNALRTLLKPLRLSFIVRNEVLTITALDCPDHLATVRTFPLGRLTEQMDDPSELISTLEIIWPDDTGRLGDEKICQPRARILANHLVVRGSPRHLDLAEQLIDGLMAQRPEPEVKATLKLPPGMKSQVLPLPSKEPNLRKSRETPPKPEPPRAPKASEPETALR